MKLSASGKMALGGSKVLASLCLLVLVCGSALCLALQVGGDQPAPASRNRRSPEPSESNIANAKIQLSGADMSAQAAHHGKSYGGGGGHGKYYMYAESPKKGAHSFGYKRGNHKFSIEGKESAHKSHVHGYVKWHDKKGKGSHKYEYKHSDHKKKKHHY